MGIEACFWPVGLFRPAKKCWCGEELITGFVMVDDGKGGMEKAPLDAEPRCPDHGEDCVWQPCAVAAEPFKRDRMLRGCRLIYGLHRLIANPETCAGCPVPAMVEALQAVVVLKLMGDGFRSVHPSLGAQCEAALAAVDRPGEGARDAT